MSQCCYAAIANLNNGITKKRRPMCKLLLYNIWKAPRCQSYTHSEIIKMYELEWPSYRPTKAQRLDQTYQYQTGGQYINRRCDDKLAPSYFRNGENWRAVIPVCARIQKREKKCRQRYFPAGRRRAIFRSFKSQRTYFFLFVNIRL